MSHDPVNNPSHYTEHPSGIECIKITEHMGFNLGNALKYIWRCDLKKDAIEDLKKAAWYIERELQKRLQEDNPKYDPPKIWPKQEDRIDSIGQNGNDGDHYDKD